MTRAVRTVAVVVPARDEEGSLPACLASVATACAALPVPAATVVAADHCSDATADVAAAAGALVTVCLGDPAAGVGAARAAGCAYALDNLPAFPPEGIWLAHTDADTQVPADWLLSQLGVAGSGADAFVGRVTLAPGASEARRARWHAAYDHSRAGLGRHQNVHGANLGVRADAYLAVGGFSPVPAHEDVGLVDRLTAAGRPVRWVDVPRVVTSPRLHARAPAGVAADLRALR